VLSPLVSTSRQHRVPHNQVQALNNMYSSLTVADTLIGSEASHRACSRVRRQRLSSLSELSDEDLNHTLDLFMDGVRCRRHKQDIYANALPVVMAADHLVPGHSTFTQLQPTTVSFSLASPTP
jgi:hypothetical protein